MKVILYCSYDFSANGFQFVSVDFEKKATERVTRNDGIPDDIFTFFVRSGVLVLSGFTEEKKGFFIVKELKHFDASKSEGDPGYTQHYRLAFISDNKHSPDDVFRLAAFVLENYQNFIPEIASMFILKPEIHEGYTVDVDKLSNFIRRATTASIEKNRFAKITEGSKNRFRFAVLFNDWNYALEMFKMAENTPPPDMIISREELEKPAKPSSPPFHPPLSHTLPPQPSVEKYLIRIKELEQENKVLKERAETLPVAVKPPEVPKPQTIKELVRQPAVIGLIIAGFLAGLCIGRLF